MLYLLRLFSSQMVLMPCIYLMFLCFLINRGDGKRENEETPVPP